MLGGVRAYLAEIPSDRDISRLAPSLCTLQGEVVSDVPPPVPSHQSSSEDALCVLRVNRAQVGASPFWLKADGLVRVRLYFSRSHILNLPSYGDTLSARGLLTIPEGLRNPGGTDEASLLAQQEVHAEFLVKHQSDWRVVHPASVRPIQVILYTLRHAILARIETLLPNDEAQLLGASLLGMRSNLSLKLQDAYNRTGASWLLVIGGMQIGVLAITLPFLFRLFGLQHRPALALSAICIVCYCLLAGGRPTLERASVVACVTLIALALEREPDWPTSMAFAALILLFLNPLELVSIGFLLTFSVVITLAMLMPPMMREFAKWENKIIKGSKKFHRIFKWMFHLLVVSFFSGVCAEIGAAPIMAIVFHQMAPIAPITVVPLALIASLTLFLAPVTLLLPLPPLVLLLKSVVGFQITTAKALSSPTWELISVRTPPAWAVILYVSLLVCCVLWIKRINEDKSETPSPQWISAASLTVLLFLVGHIGLWAAGELYKPGDGDLKVTFLDVGQGDACVIETPSGRVILVDTGPVNEETGEDAGRNIVAPFLRYEGDNSIDAIILTHPHADHIGGAASLIKLFPVNFILDNGQHTGSPEEAEYRAAALNRHEPDENAVPGQKIDCGDGVHIEVIAPTQSEVQGPPNNASVVIRLSYGETSFLLMGDAEEPEEQSLLSSGYPLDCTVLKVGHHGSNTSSCPQFLLSAKPQFAIVSVGAHNIYGHPSPDVMQRLYGEIPHVYRTDQNGAVTCLSNGADVACSPIVRGAGN